MARFQLSSPQWKLLISTLAFLSSLLLVLEFTQAIRPLLIENTQGSLGIGLDQQIKASRDGQGSQLLRIESISPESPLQAAGAQAGDIIRFDHYQDRWRKFSPGEVVGMTLFQAAGQKHFMVAAQPSAIPFSDYFDYVSRLLLAIVAILFSLLIGIKQSNGQAYRALAITFLSLSMMLYFPFNYSPSGTAFTLSKLANIAGYNIIWYSCTVFALHYQNYERSRVRTMLERTLPVYRLLVIAATAYALWFGLGHEAPALGTATMLVAVGGLAIILCSLNDGWRQSGGEMRQRHLWLLGSFFCGSPPAILTLIPAFDWSIFGTRVAVMLFFLGQFLMYGGLAYAVLKHQVFNFNFAISRAVVFSFVSLTLLCCFGIIEWLYASAMHGGGNSHGEHQKSLVVDAALALLAYLIFHKVHGTLEHWAERFFFQKWHHNEERLRHYVRHAAHITTVDALLASLRAALDRFTGQAGCAVYLRQPGGEYTLACASLPQAPSCVGVDDAIAVGLRTIMAPLPTNGIESSVSGELALPMSHRGTLNGFVLLGRRHKGESYRPDEIEVLNFTVHQIGLDLHALRVEMLEQELQKLERKTEHQNTELQLMAGRRKQLRGALDTTEASPSPT